MERLKNNNIFVSACNQLKVKTSLLLTEASIERLKTEDWQKMVELLQSFAIKMESNDPNDPRKKAFKVNLNNLKLSIDQLSKEWEQLKLDETYSTLVYEDETFMSVYEDLDMTSAFEEPTPEELEDIYLVSLSLEWYRDEAFLNLFEIVSGEIHENEHKRLLQKKYKLRNDNITFKSQCSLLSLSTYL